MWCPAHAYERNVRNTVILKNKINVQLVKGVTGIGPTHTEAMPAARAGTDCFTGPLTLPIFVSSTFRQVKAKVIGMPYQPPFAQRSRRHAPFRCRIC